MSASASDTPSAGGGTPDTRAISRVIVAILAAAGLAAVAFLMPPAGATGPDWLRASGRLHPLVVHLPIALAMIVPFLDLAGRWWRKPAWTETAEIILAVAALSGFGAALIGILLGYADGHEGAGVRLHQWLGVAAASLLALAWAVRPLAAKIHIPVAVVALAVVSAAGHIGGELTHGERYLTEFLPRPLAALLGDAKARQGLSVAPAAPTAPGTVVASAPAAASPTIYQALVSPIMERSCVSCHGANKQKGGLRLDSLAAMRLAGKSKAVAVVPGHPETSELVRRITLAADADEIMPPDGKPLLPAAEIAALGWWIASGADGETTLTGSAVPVPEAVKPLLAKIAMVPVASAPGHATAAPSTAPVIKSTSTVVRIDRSWVGQWAKFSALAERAGAAVAPISAQPEDGLHLRGFSSGVRMTTASVATLAPLAPYVVEADLQGSAVDDGVIAQVKSWPHLRRLDLSRTKLTGATLGDLTAAGELRVLLLNETKLSDAGITALARIPSLVRVGLSGVTLSDPVLKALIATRPGLAIGNDAVPAP